MEACSSHFYRFPYSPPPQSPSKLPPPLEHHRVVHLRHHVGGDGSGFAMRFQTLQRIATNSIFIPSTRSYPIPINHSLDYNFTLNDSMDDSDVKREIQSGDGLVVLIDKKETKSQEDIPPPPEKPLPGDCCGSGCVRCVWDVYYEELEEYNKLYKNKSDSKISSKAS